MIPQQPTSSRLKVFYVGQSYFLFMLSGIKAETTHIQFPQLHLPPTAQVRNIWVDEQRRAFGVLVEDESFDEVREGIMAPQIHIEWHFAKLAIEPFSPVSSN